MPLGLGLGITKLKSLVSGLRVRFQGNATITAALDGILRDLSADFVSNGTVTAALEAIKLLDVDFSGDGTLTGDLADYAYLLDDYSGAAAAYSIRLLSSTYSGALVEIRRSSDNALKSFYPDSSNELSLSSEDGSSTTLSSWIGSDNGFVRTWYDQSGNANDATQTSAASQPQIISSGAFITENGKPITSSGATTTYPISYVIDGTNRNVLFVGKRGPVLSCLIGSQSGGSDLYMMSQSGSTANGVFNATQVSTRINGAAATITDRNSVYTEFTSQIILNGVANFTFGSRNICLSYNNATLGFGTMNFQELVIWESSQGTGIETNANNFYNVY